MALQLLPQNWPFWTNAYFSIGKFMGSNGRGIKNVNILILTIFQQSYIKDGPHAATMKDGNKFGKIYGSFIGIMPTFNVWDLDIVKDIMVKDFSSFPDRMVFIIINFS